MTTLTYIQAILSILIIASILIQKSDSGVGGAFGGDGWNSAYHTRRGFEKAIFNITIVLAVLFAVTSLAALLVR
ncbi:MAG: preprotein translocase subunit SecG [Candidatus Paceibacterota bacterium]|jgi:protein translocase SecG subunit